MISSLLAGLMLVAGLLAAIAGVAAGLVLLLLWAISRTSPEEDYEAEAFGDVPHVDRRGARRQEGR